ncbi:Beta-lactamase domain-containing protein 2 [Diplonema papillatum]|nr:Beta-lactamase domain-containing protein 2 [Diplonema papillatum]
MAGLLPVWLVGVAATMLSLVLSPAYLVHGKNAVYCNLVGCKAELMGRCHEDFQLVRRVFEENFEKRGETGAAVAVYFRGELVADLWGGDWSQFRQAKLRSLGGLGGVAAALLVEQRRLSLADSVADLWPGFRRWLAGGDDVTVGDILQQRFTLRLETRDNSARGKPDTTRIVVQALRPAVDEFGVPDQDVQGFAFYPYIADVVMAAVVPLVDRKKRSFEEFVADEIRTPLGIDHGDLTFTHPRPGVPAAEGVLPDRLALLIRSFSNASDAWCGPYPLRDLWHRELFAGANESRLGLSEYLSYQQTILEQPTPLVYATAKALARVYSSIASGDPAASEGANVEGHGLFKTAEAIDLFITNATGFGPALDDMGNNVSKSQAGFALTSNGTSFFTLKETRTHGRRWAHFGWSGFGGSYAAASVGHGIAVVYLTAREGPYEKDPRVSGVLEAVNEVVYWKEMDEFTQDLKKKNLVGGDGMQPDLSGFDANAALH